MQVDQEALAKRWGRVRVWNLDEAARILAGLAPGTHLPAEWDEDADRTVLYSHIFDILERELEREIFFGGMTRGGLTWSPSQVIQACDVALIDVPPLLRQVVVETEFRRTGTWPEQLAIDPLTATEEQLAAKYPGQGRKEPSLEKAAPTEGSRRYNTLLKVIAAMAADGYSWNPNERSTTASEIEAQTERFGERVSAETILSVLREAAGAVDYPSSGTRTS